MIQALLDILLTGVVLCVFALFHHVIPRMNLDPSGIPKPIETVAASPEYNKEESDTERPWHEKFSEHFTSDTVATDDSYSSPNISVRVTEHSGSTDGGALKYFVADIYVSEVENFQTCFVEKGQYALAEPIAERNQAIVAINGDYYNNQPSGLLVRNGTVYLTEQTECDICVLYYDGTMVTYGPDEYIAEEVISDRPYQVWKFGPALLESDGSPKSKFNTSSSLLQMHPRSGLGYYEPGHYCFIVVDGRGSNGSQGIDMRGFAELFSELGCVSAYNMDGGASSAMVFEGQTVNIPCNGGRELADMLLIKEIDGSVEGGA